MRNIVDIEDEIASEFEILEDPMDRYDYLIELGRKLPTQPVGFHTDDKLVKGCQSKVWLESLKEGDQIIFKADCNTAIAKGIVALLIRVLSGQKAETIIHANLEVIDRIQLRSHLSSQRANGLNAMIQQMKAFAALHLTSSN